MQAVVSFCGPTDLTQSVWGKVAVEKGITDTGSLARYCDAWDHAADRTPHGAPIVLQPEDFPA